MLVKGAPGQIHQSQQPPFPFSTSRHWRWTVGLFKGKCSPVYELIWSIVNKTRVLPFSQIDNKYWHYRSELRLLEMWSEQTLIKNSPSGEFFLSFIVSFTIFWIQLPTLIAALLVVSDSIMILIWKWANGCSNSCWSPVHWYLSAYDDMMDDNSNDFHITDPLYRWIPPKRVNTGLLYLCC